MFLFQINIQISKNYQIKKKGISKEFYVAFLDLLSPKSYTDATFLYFEQFLNYIKCNNVALRIHKKLKCSVNEEDLAEF